MELELKHITPYLPYGINYYPSEKSDLFHDYYADNNLGTSWNYITALENKDEFAIKLSKSYLIPNIPFITIEDGDLFLGQFTSSLGFDVDDVFASEVKLILKPMSDLKDKQIKELLNLYPNTENFQYTLKHAKGYHFKNLSASFVEYCIMEKLIEWHYDVFGLIEKGLAKDINEL